jgi:spore maturation protein CgeB
MNVVFFGLSITSSWGNGHATNYRALVRALHERGHRVLFLEREAPWYAQNRDMPDPPWGRTELYEDPADIERFENDVRTADLVIVGSYVPDGAVVADWALDTCSGIVAFWDIDTPLTLASIGRGGVDYLSADQVPRFDLYLSFTGGPILRHIESELGARSAVAFYCMADPRVYFPTESQPTFSLGYLGTYSRDRQPVVQSLLLEPARRLPHERFAVCGPQYPADLEWPPNVERIEHLAPGDHCGFYASQRFTLNATRAAMVAAGWSPSVRLFEAAACGVPIISDWWEGLDSFFLPGEEILVARSTDDVDRYLTRLDEVRRREIGMAGRRRVLAEHTPTRRAEELEQHVLAARRAAA